MLRRRRLWLNRWGPWPARLLGGLALLLLGVAAGLASTHYGLLLPIAILAGLALAATALLHPRLGFLLATILAILLPFAVLPVSLGLTPSFLELTLLGVLAGWVLPPLLRGERRWRFTWLDGLAWAFVGLTLASLLLGLGRGVDATVLHNYGKALLGLLTFFAVRQLVQKPADMRKFLAVFLLAAGLAALLGLFLYALPDRSAESLLVQLSAVGYPAEGRVLRYVEDNPSGLERAIGTAVDPNSFGGMLALAGAIALGEVLAWPGFASNRVKRIAQTWRNVPTFQRSDTPTLQPLGDRLSQAAALPLLLLLTILSLLVVCLYLTYSRAALGGFLVAVLFLATVRYRRLWWGLVPIALVLVLLVAGLGGNSPVVERFRQGLAFQDLANRMRLAEFANAAAIIQRYPVFGVGFGHAPDVDLSTGVSSLYLTIAERMGLAGLLSFLAFAGAAFVQTFREYRQDNRDDRPAERGNPSTSLRASLKGQPYEDQAHRLALLAGAVAALAMGLLDHYFFNLEFPHMVMLLWAILGLATVDPVASTTTWGCLETGEGSQRGSPRCVSRRDCSYFLQTRSTTSPGLPCTPRSSPFRITRTPPAL
jgi:O-antigen ligase